MNENAMKQKPMLFSRAFFGLIGSLALAQMTEAQVFTYQNNDLVLGFRKTGVFAENYEVVVNIGQASNYLKAATGTILTVPNFSLSQLVLGSFTSLNNLSWSVVGYYSGSGYGVDYPATTAITLWVTVPRENNAVRSADAIREYRGTQLLSRASIASILSNAGFISRDLGTSNQFNSPFLVRESIATYQAHILSAYMGGTTDNTFGNLQDHWTQSNLEIATPDNFNGAVRSDLYEVRPLRDAQGNTIVDPHTGTNGLAYYVGYFEFKSDGTMTFTREEASTPPPPPPPAPVLSAQRTGNTTTISFLSTNGAIYTLYYTNTSGLTALLSTWPSLPGTVTGDGSQKTFQDTSADSDRVYRVKAQ